MEEGREEREREKGRRDRGREGGEGGGERDLLIINNTFGTSHFVFCREVVLSSEVILYRVCIQDIGVGSGGARGVTRPPNLPTVYIMNFIAVL